VFCKGFYCIAIGLSAALLQEIVLSFGTQTFLEAEPDCGAEIDIRTQRLVRTGWENIVMYCFLSPSKVAIYEVSLG